MRRPARAEKSGKVPATKKLKLDSTSSLNVLSASDKAELDLIIETMQKNYSSNKWTAAGAMHMLQQTERYRRQWIKEESPNVKDILAKYPCLNEAKIVNKSLL